MNKPADQLDYFTRCDGAIRAQLQHPHYSTCGRCGQPWATVTKRSIYYHERRGMFALCQACWNELGTAQHRTPYYLGVLARWRDESARLGIPDDDLPADQEVIDGVVMASITLPRPKVTSA